MASQRKVVFRGDNVGGVGGVNCGICRMNWKWKKCLRFATADLFLLFIWLALIVSNLNKISSQFHTRLLLLTPLTLDEFSYNLPDCLCVVTFPSGPTTCDVEWKTPLLLVKDVVPPLIFGLSSSSLNRLSRPTRFAVLITKKVCHDFGSRQHFASQKSCYVRCLDGWMNEWMSCGSHKCNLLN